MINLYFSLLKKINMNKPLFSGKVAFTLYDTYGFPLDLTQSILRERGIEVDVDEFNAEMQKQKEMAKKAWVGSGDVKNSKVYFEIKEKIAPTEFLGYEKNTASGKILALIRDGKEVEEVNSGDEFEFFVDKTPFYGECGGQVGDSGLGLKIQENGVIMLPFSTIEIYDVKRPFPHHFLHKAKMVSGSKLKVGDIVNLSIDVEKRNKIKANHSATHLLQYALRSIFGDTLMQKGSSVDENRLRFDFTLNKAIKREEIAEIERIVNELIYKNTPIITKVMNIEEARKTGAMALFGEKYEDDVRVIFMGEKTKNTQIKSTENNIDNIANTLNQLNNSSLKTNCSIEFCGGTHASKTGEIGVFKIVSEGAIASGIRRIEAYTGLKAIEYMNSFQNIINNINVNLQVGLNDFEEKIDNLIKENKEFKKQLENIKKSNMASIAFEEENNGIKFAFNVLKGVNPKEIKGPFIDIQNKKYNTNSIMLSIINFEGKTTIILGISKDLNVKFKANELIKDLVAIAGGNGGGGQPWFAMGGATEQNNPETAKKIVEFIRLKINE